MCLWAMFRSMAEYEDYARGGKDEGPMLQIDQGRGKQRER